MSVSVIDLGFPSGSSVERPSGRPSARRVARRVAALVIIFAVGLCASADAVDGGPTLFPLRTHVALQTGRFGNTWAIRDGWLYALTKTGAVAGYSLKHGGSVVAAWTTSVVSYSDDAVWLSAYQDAVVVNVQLQRGGEFADIFDPATGRKLWRSPHMIWAQGNDGSLIEQHMLKTNGLPDGSSVSGLDPRTGHSRFTRTFAANVLVANCPTNVARQNRNLCVIRLDSGGRLTLVDIQTGETLAAGRQPVPSVAEGQSFVLTPEALILARGTGMFAYDPQSLVPLWKLPQLQDALDWDPCGSAICLARGNHVEILSPTNGQRLYSLYGSKTAAGAGRILLVHARDGTRPLDLQTGTLGPSLAYWATGRDVDATGTQTPAVPIGTVKGAPAEAFGVLVSTGAGGWLGRYNPAIGRVTALGVLDAGVDPKTCASTGSFIGCTDADGARLSTWRQNIP